jgi:formylglycine-generating enzyme required for sulfatase activity
MEIGHDGEGFCFDNELPRHKQYVAPFALASRLVTNGEYLAFIDAGGYANAALWLAEGWDWVRTQHLQAPIYWFKDEQGAWQEFTLHGAQPLDLQSPADAHLAVRSGCLCALGRRPPADRSGVGIRRLPHASGADVRPLLAMDQQQLFAVSGLCGGRGALGEYNGKFMLNQYVLRGSSSATPEGHARASYRNFFPAGARWQFTGIRLAR